MSQEKLPPFWSVFKKQTGFFSGTISVFYSLQSIQNNRGRKVGAGTVWSNVKFLAEWKFRSYKESNLTVCLLQKLKNWKKMKFSSIYLLQCSEASTVYALWKPQPWQLLVQVWVDLLNLCCKFEWIHVGRSYLRREEACAIQLHQCRPQYVQEQVSQVQGSGGVWRERREECNRMGKGREFQATDSSLLQSLIHPICAFLPSLNPLRCPLPSHHPTTPGAELTSFSTYWSLHWCGRMVQAFLLVPLSSALSQLNFYHICNSACWRSGHSSGISWS